MHRSAYIDHTVSLGRGDEGKELFHPPSAKADEHVLAERIVFRTQRHCLHGMPHSEINENVWVEYRHNAKRGLSFQCHLIVAPIGGSSRSRIGDAHRAAIDHRSSEDRVRLRYVGHVSHAV